MLPTKEKAKLFIDHRNFKHPLLIEGPFGISDDESIYQHLYILSDEEIKEGDWYAANVSQSNREEDADGEIHAVKEYTNTPVQKIIDICKEYKLPKVIATTDSSLECEQDRFLKGYKSSLPEPSEAFIEKYIEAYNNGTPITDVLIEYEESYDLEYYTPAGGIETAKRINYSDKLKVDKSNTITIKRVKDSWNREEHISEVKRIIELYVTTYKDGDINKWIEDNL